MDDDNEQDDPYNPHSTEDWDDPLAPDDLDRDNVADDEEEDDGGYSY